MLTGGGAKDLVEGVGGVIDSLHHEHGGSHPMLRG